MSRAGFECCDQGDQARESHQLIINLKPLIYADYHRLLDSLHFLGTDGTLKDSIHYYNHRGCDSNVCFDT